MNEHWAQSMGHGAEGFECGMGNVELGIRNGGCGMENEERRSWEGRKLKSSKLNAQREPSAVGGALRLRLEAEKVYLPLLLNQRTNALTNQPDLIEP